MLDRVEEELVFVHLYGGPPVETRVRKEAVARMGEQLPVWRQMLPDLFGNPWVSARRYV